MTAADRWAKVWAVVRAVWKPLAIAVAAVVAFFLIKKAVQGVLQVVARPSNWQKIEGDPTHVLVDAGDGTKVTVELPRDQNGVQVTSDQVRAVGYQPGYAAQVEVRTDVQDRRS